jgi:ubiquinone/menaquinone biosynthesis C-methylase UbiE
MAQQVHPERRTVSETETQRANRREWDGYADEYQATHGLFLRDVGFLWCPEGLTEQEAGVLGEVAGARVLEVGCGAAQCGRWLASQGARPVGLDLSERQLQHARRIDGDTGLQVPVVAGTATALPFADATFDVVFSAFGALQFVADAGRAVDEAVRVLRPGGTFAFSITHPVRWCLPDDPGEEGLLVSSSYWDRTPYVEVDDDGRTTYVEHHRTLGDWVALLSAAGLRITSLLEPEWPEGNERVWGGWGPVRGRLIPGTAVLAATSPG